MYDSHKPKYLEITTLPTFSLSRHIPKSWVNQTGDNITFKTCETQKGPLDIRTIKGSSPWNSDGTQASSLTSRLYNYY